jgi:hypothetical protein
MALRFLLATACILTCAGATPADEPLPSRSNALLDTYRFYHGPGTQGIEEEVRQLGIYLRE